MRLGTPLEREFTLRSALVQSPMVCALAEGFVGAFRDAWSILHWAANHPDAVVVIGCALCFIIALQVA